MSSPASRPASGAEPTRRERQREATYAEIVESALGLLREGEDLSLRAVAQRMGMTAPALYRYVASYSELVDLVALRIDQDATRRFAAAAETVPASDPAARLVLAITEFRTWAMTSPREFSLVFAHPVAEPGCRPGEPLTAAASAELFTTMLHDVWRANRFPVPAVEDLPEVVRQAVLDPAIPGPQHHLPVEERGFGWVAMQGWAQLYGVVALEVFGHVDVRLLASGELFLSTLGRFAPQLGLGADVERLVGLARARIAAA
ncbi:WHG domain-containing protein [Nocardioides sp. GY 10127]|uniref:TetR/AcrR family transcriptional regulator n=1 Tax=Nocardioides sp. GY 10127 TaxID=2569762 RepID=UPI0010A843C7|nr:WHG domain-containing protein [Nocardioides sp. GY 10127]TIC82580.1 TetR/AcrR family transcriptional regulator [Nocardioides sp. GY 10127]